MFLRYPHLVGSGNSEQNMLAYFRMLHEIAPVGFDWHTHQWFYSESGILVMHTLNDFVRLCESEGQKRWWSRNCAKRCEHQILTQNLTTLKPSSDVLVFSRSWHVSVTFFLVFAEQVDGITRWVEGQMRWDWEWIAWEKRVHEFWNSTVAVKPFTNVFVNTKWWTRLRYFFGAICRKQLLEEEFAQQKDRINDGQIAQRDVNTEVWRTTFLPWSFSMV